MDLLYAINNSLQQRLDSNNNIKNIETHLPTP